MQPISRFFVTDPTGAFDSVQRRIPKTTAELAKFQAHGDKLLALAMVEKNESAHKQDGPAVARLLNFLSFGLYKNPKRTQAGGLVASLTVEVADAVRSSAPHWHFFCMRLHLISEIAISSLIVMYVLPGQSSFTRSQLGQLHDGRSDGSGYRRRHCPYDALFRCRSQPPARLIGARHVELCVFLRAFVSFVCVLVIFHL